MDNVVLKISADTRGAVQADQDSLSEGIDNSLRLGERRKVIRSRTAPRPVRRR